MSQGSVYERQVDQILTGGWNLLPPGDLVEKAEALQCENFRVDSAGNLRSRFGNGKPIWTPGPVRSFCHVKGVAVTRYAATYMGTLLRDGVPIDGGAFGTVPMIAVTTGFASVPIGMVSYQGFLWAMGRKAQKKDNGADLLDWTPAAPADPVVTPGGGGFLVSAENYTYWVTYAADNGQESPSNPKGTTVVAAGADPSNTITSPAASADPQVIGWNVYRIGNTLEQAQRLNADPLTIGVDFVDTGDPGSFLDDVQVANLGIALDPHASGPPAGTGLAGPYYDHLLAWGVEAHPNRLFWSGTRQPYNFPGATLEEGNHVDVGEFGEQFVGITIRPRVATIYKDSSIWRLVGDPDDLSGDLELVTDEIGAIGAQAIISVGGTDYFQGPEGLYAYNGEKPRKISGKLDILFRSERPEFAGFAFSTGIRLNPAAASLQRNCIAHRRGRLYFFYCGGDGSFLPNRGIVQEVGADNWGSDSRAVTAILSEGTAAVDEVTGSTTSEGLLLASVASYLPGDPGQTADMVALEEEFVDSSRFDAGFAIPLSYHSGYKDQGAPENLKTYADVVIEHATGGAKLTVGAFYNNGVDPIPDKLTGPSEALGVIQSVTRTITTFQLALGSDNLGIKARNIAIRIEGDASPDAVALIYKILVHYFVEPRDSKTYDSDETDLGSEKVKALIELELDIDFPAIGGGATAWQVFADRDPGVSAGGAVSTPAPPAPATTPSIPATVTQIPPAPPALLAIDYPALAYATGMFQGSSLSNDWFLQGGVSVAGIAADGGVSISPELWMIFQGLGYAMSALVYDEVSHLPLAAPTAAFIAQWPEEAVLLTQRGILAGLVPPALIPAGYSSPLSAPAPAPIPAPGPAPPPAPTPTVTTYGQPVPGSPTLFLRDFGNVTPTAGRQIIRIPLNGQPPGPVEGRLVRVALRNDLTFFRLYGVRLRVLPYGEYIDNSVGETFQTLDLNVGSA